MIVRLKSDTVCPASLRSDKPYIVYGLEEGSYRLVDEEEEPILHEQALFDILDDRLPSDWIRTEYEDGALYVEPPETSEPGFYEDWHDGILEARTVFAVVRRRIDEWQARPSIAS